MVGEEFSAHAMAFALTEAGLGSPVLARPSTARQLSSQRSSGGGGGSVADVALASAGTRLTLASSCCHRHPPEAVIDGSERTFWLSTGIFPQTLVLSFASHVQVHRLRMVTRGVREFAVERCEEETPHPSSFVPVMSLANLPERPLQKETHDINRATARHIRLVVLDGWEPFVSVHKVSVDGTVKLEE